MSNVFNFILRPNIKHYSIWLSVTSNFRLTVLNTRNLYTLPPYLRNMPFDRDVPIYTS